MAAPHLRLDTIVLPTPSRASALVTPVWVGLVLLAAARAALWALLPHANEDAYITFRFARNLAEGGGLAYNAGERTFGFTSPLWTLWCALGQRLFGDPLVWARLTAVAADGVTLVILTRMLERHASRTAAWVFALGFAAWPLFPALAVSGLEMSVMNACLALSVWAVERGSRAAGPTLALLALMRPEGLVAAGIAAVWARPRDRWIALGLVAAGVLALTAYFGSPLPRSLVAKSSTYGLPGPWGGRHWWLWLVPVELGEWPQQLDLLALFQSRILIAPAAVVGFLLVRRTALAPFVWGALAVWIGYVLSGVAYFFWYLATPAALVFVLAAAGLPRIVRGRAVFVALALLLAGTWSMQVARGYGPRARSEGELFGTIADELRSRARPGESVLLEPIGLIGWRNPGVRVLDEVGLVTPGIAELRREGDGWYGRVLDQERPDWLVLRYGFFASLEPYAGSGRPFRTEDERNRALVAYQPVAKTGGENPDLNDLILLRRR
jgi:hypothetical protein